MLKVRPREDGKTPAAEWLERESQQRAAREGLAATLWLNTGLERAPPGSRWSQGSRAAGLTADELRVGATGPKQALCAVTQGGAASTMRAAVTTTDARSVGHRTRKAHSTREGRTGQVQRSEGLRRPGPGATRPTPPSRPRGLHEASAPTVWSETRSRTEGTWKRAPTRDAQETRARVKRIRVDGGHAALLPAGKCGPRGRGVLETTAASRVAMCVSVACVNTCVAKRQTKTHYKNVNLFEQKSI